MSENRSRLDKFGIAAVLQEIGTLQELKGGPDRFKARAYKAGARIVAGLTEDLGKLVDEHRLTSIRGIGNALASQIEQLYLTGESSVLKDLRKEFPRGVIELLQVPGLSIAKIAQLNQALGISSIEELQAAAEAGKLRNVKGFGAKTEQKLLEALKELENHAQADKPLHIHHAERTGEQVLAYLQTSRSLEEAIVAGAARRWQETVGVVRIVASSKNPARLVQHFLRFPMIVSAEDQTADGVVVSLADGARVALTVVHPKKFPLALFWGTGSSAHLKRVQNIAAEQGFKLERQNLSPVETRAKRAARSIEVRSEEDLYRRLGMQYVPPELREDVGEVEAAIARKLPEDLITVQDIQGMVHCHTTYSDGKHSILEMARAAEAMGMKYITITDHSPSAFYANGVKLDRLKRQWEEIDEVQDQVKIRLLRGTESDILADGLLDYPDRILEQFDVIVASIHSRHKMDSEKMTRRIVTAMQQPVFKIWGHALGRLIERRPPFECDVERVLDAIAASRAAVEVNGDPYRLDMEPRWLREARKRKIKFVISVDAHSSGALNNLKYGIGIARRGWVRRGEVLNTLNLKGFQKSVRPGL